MDARTYFEIDEADDLTDDQAAFLDALGQRLHGRIRPSCVEVDGERLLLVADFDAPDVALATVGLELTGRELRGDRVSLHDRSFPDSPTRFGFALRGSPAELADRAAELLEAFARRPVVRHEWLHRGEVYATCYVFEDDGERRAQTYRSDLAPEGQADQVVAEGDVFGKGWIQTRGLGAPDRVVRIPGWA